MKKDEILKNLGLLSEGTYDLSPLEPLKKFLIQKLSKRFALHFYNVTKYFNHYIGDKKISISLNMTNALYPIAGRDKSSGVTASTNSPIEPERTNILININKKLMMGVSENYDDFVEMFDQTFDHEIIHVLDIIRSTKKLDSGVYYTKLDRIRKDSKKQEGSAKYITSTLEFNRTVNEIAKNKKLNNNEWKHFNSLKTAYEISKYFLKTALNLKSDHDFNKIDDNGIKSLSRDTSFINKIISRLSREGLMPQKIDFADRGKEVKPDKANSELKKSLLPPSKKASKIFKSREDRKLNKEFRSLEDVLNSLEDLKKSAIKK